MKNDNWIKATERMPPHDMDILVSDGENINIGDYNVLRKFGDK